MLCITGNNRHNKIFAIFTICCYCDFCSELMNTLKIWQCLLKFTAPKFNISLQQENVSGLDEINFFVQKKNLAIDQLRSRGKN